MMLVSPMFRGRGQHSKDADQAKPIEAQTSTSSPNQARQDSTAKV